MEDEHTLIAVDPAAGTVAELDAAGGLVVPALIADAGPNAARRFLEFFAATIRNANTREAYHRAVLRFFAWCDRHAIGGLADIEPLHVAAYVEGLQVGLAKPSVKQHLAAIRMLFDWLVAGGLLRMNPAAPVRGPKYTIKRGKTTVLAGHEARALLDSIDTSTVIGLRDRALIALLTYSFARIGAAVNMKVEDYYQAGKRWRLRLHEKGGKHHDLPCHHSLQDYLDTYLDAAGIAGNAKSPLFRTARGHVGALSDRGLSRHDAYAMIRRRAAAASLGQIGCHTFRATGITAYLGNGGALEHAQAIAAHESPRTTKLYDRTGDEITLDEIERIIL